MERVEFSKKTRIEAFQRCAGRCEKCDAHLKVGEAEYDHVIPYYFTRDSSLGNCQVLCVPCHRGVGGKTADDQADISKSKRIWMKHNGVWPESKAKLKGRSFAKTRNIP